MQLGSGDDIFLKYSIKISANTVWPISSLGPKFQVSALVSDFLMKSRSRRLRSRPHHWCLLWLEFDIWQTEMSSLCGKGGATNCRNAFVVTNYCSTAHWRLPVLFHTNKSMMPQLVTKGWNSSSVCRIRTTSGGKKEEKTVVLRQSSNFVLNTGQNFLKVCAKGSDKLFIARSFFCKCCIDLCRFFSRMPRVLG